MRRLGTALLAIATLMLGAAPLAAHAQDKAKTAITKEQRDKGMKDAPAAVQKAGVACTVTDAAYLGASKTKDGQQDVYEVACQQGMGYVVLSGAKEAKAYDCLAAASQPTLACKLPENADPKQGLKADIASAGVVCTPTNARYLGANATTSVYEVACQQGPGFLLQAPQTVSAATPVVAVPCIQTIGTANACTLTDKAQDAAFLAGLVAKTGKSCQISGSRYIGSDKTSGASYYEIGCGQQAGFVLSADKAGSLDRVITCGEAQALGGCKLTDSTQIASQESATYTRLAKAGGFNCDVSKYRPIGLDANKDEVVELACSNRPDGVVAMFPSAPGGRTQFVDCVKAGEFGPNGACTLSSPTPVYAKYTAALAAKGRSSCKVSGARYLGKSPQGTDFVETACADGNPGWVIELTSSDTVKSLLSCGQAKSVGLACELPTNAKG